MHFRGYTVDVTYRQLNRQCRVGLNAVMAGSTCFGICRLQLRMKPVELESTRNLTIGLKLHKLKTSLTR